MISPLWRLDFRPLVQCNENLHIVHWVCEKGRHDSACCCSSCRGFLFLIKHSRTPEAECCTAAALGSPTTVWQPPVSGRLFYGNLIDVRLPLRHHSGGAAPIRRRSSGQKETAAVSELLKAKKNCNNMIWVTEWVSSDVNWFLTATRPKSYRYVAFWCFFPLSHASVKVHKTSAHKSQSTSPGNKSSQRLDVLPASFSAGRGAAKTLWPHNWHVLGSRSRKVAQEFDNAFCGKLTGWMHWPMTWLLWNINFGPQLPATVLTVQKRLEKMWCVSKKSCLTSFAYDHFLETTTIVGKSPSRCITASSEIVNQCVVAWWKVPRTKQTPRPDTLSCGARGRKWL